MSEIKTNDIKQVKLEIHGVLQATEVFIKATEMELQFYDGKDINHMDGDMMTMIFIVRTKKSLEIQYFINTLEDLSRMFDGSIKEERQLFTTIVYIMEQLKQKRKDNDKKREEIADKLSVKSNNALH